MDDQQQKIRAISLSLLTILWLVAGAVSFAGVAVAEDTAVDTNSSSVTPTTATADTTQEFDVTVVINNTPEPNETGEVDVRFEGFEIADTSDGDGEETIDDVTIDYSASDISEDGTLTVSTAVNATAPTSTGTYHVNVTDLRKNGSEGDYIIEDANISIATVTVESTTWTAKIQETGEKFDSIQSALDNASDSQTIEVSPGVYSEQLVIEQNITLTAPDGATLEGPKSDTFGTAAIQIPPDNVSGVVSPVIRGVTIEGYDNGLFVGGSGDGDLVGEYEEVSTGDWVLEDVTIHDSGAEGIDASSSTGDWQIKDTTIVNSTDEGVDADGATGEWLLADSVVRQTGREGIRAVNTESPWVIRNVTVQNSSDVGIDAGYNTANWTIRDSTIVDNDGTEYTNIGGVSVISTSGDWLVTGSAIKNNRGVGIGLEPSDDGGDTVSGNWTVTQSHFVGNEGGINANSSATVGTATYNYWGAEDGPSGDFAGSGDAAFGNVTVSPYYTDSSLTSTSTFASKVSEITYDGTSASTRGTGLNPLRVAEILHVSPVNSSHISFGDGAGYQLEIENSSGSSVVIEPENNEPIASGEYLDLDIYTGDGTLRDPPEVVVNNTRVNVSVTGDTEMFAAGVAQSATNKSDPFDEYVVKLRDSDGSVIDATEPRVIGIGYNVGEGIQQNSTSGIVEFSIPRERLNYGINESWDARFSLGHTIDFEPVHIANTAGDEDFVFTIDVSDIPSDKYSHSLELLRPTEEEFHPVDHRVINIFGVDDVEIDNTQNATGTILTPDGDAPAANDKIVITGLDTRDEAALTWTNETGHFTTELPTSGDSGVYFAQTNNSDERDVTWTPDGAPDVAAIGVVNESSPNIGNYTLPSPHNLTINVTNESDAPVENAPIEIQPMIGEEGANMGMIRTGPNGTATIEVNGSLNLETHAPHDSKLLMDTRTISVSEDRTVNITLMEGVRVNGSIEYSDGADASGYWVDFVGQEYENEAYLDDAGAFDLLLAKNDTYGFVFTQGHEEIEPSYPKDGYPDVHVFDKLELTDQDHDIGSKTLPKAHLAQIQVVDENNNGVSGLDVNVSFGTEGNRRYVRAETNETGYVRLRGADSAGIEANGTIRVEVEPSPELALDGNVTEVTVDDGPERVELTLPQSETIHVPENFDTVSDAVAAANPGTTIVVGDGTYHETVRVDKPITIVSSEAVNTSDYDIGAPAGSPVLEGDGERYAGFDIQENVEGVYIEGFEIRNYTHGIRAVSNETDSVTVAHNTIVNADTGVLTSDDASSTASDVGQHSEWLIGANRIVDPAKAGIQGRNLHNSTIVANEIQRGENVGDANWSTGIAATGYHAPMQDVAIKHNIVRGQYNGTGINTIAGLLGTNETVENVQIADNYVTGEMPGDGISVGSYGNSTLGYVAIENNTVTDATTWWPGYGVFTRENGTITHVDLINNTAMGNVHGIGISIWGGGSYGSVTIQNNEIENNLETGVFVAGNTPTENISFHENNITGNADYGVLNNGTGTLDATNNWWGDSSGPYHPETNSGGTGDNVSANVAFDPWIQHDDSTDDTDSGTEGPDISIEKTSLDQTVITAGEKAQVNVTLTNDGDADGNITVEYDWDEGTPIKYDHNVTAGETRTVSTSRVFHEAGTYNISVNGTVVNELTVEEEETTTSTEVPGMGPMTALLALMAIAFVAIPRRH